ncbi:hypothetical protein CHS0354_000672 [Potamilus streckersoni]|uniref:Catalase n=1 Tax=Potamilus streckersoni TaxID=2493646 RepID=A0AAE0T721_9BIVA|nr:hypothetical protein CHS0354_000672 [Potamilus streckersoni]
MAAEENMATDASMITLLESLESKDISEQSAVVRFYSWSENAISVGFHQNISDFDLSRLENDHVKLVRRPTGGRAVFHAVGGDLTFAFVHRATHSPTEHLLQMNKAIQVGMRFLGIEVELENGLKKNIERSNRHAICFNSLTRAELKVNNRKLVGTAQRRFGSMMIHQGTIPISENQYRMAHYLKYKNYMIEELRKNEISLQSILHREIDFNEASNHLLNGIVKQFVRALSQEKDVTNAELVQALQKTFGKHAGKRASHAKGLCYTGYFRASDNASEYSKASIFKKQSSVIPVIGRFSLAGGNPKVSDKARLARGLAARLSVSQNEQVDFVFLSTPVFFASTLQEFVGFLGARIPDPATQKPDPDKIKAFAAAHPKTTKQAKWLETHPIPSSYTATSYFGVHAFKLTNKTGKSRWVKWEFVPTKGEKSLTDDELKSKPDDFYRDQLQAELNIGEVSFDLYAVLGQDGDCAAPTPTKFTITINANGGTDGATTTIEVESGKTATLPTAGLPTRTGYTITSWFTKSNEKETVFVFGLTLVTENITIYPKWGANTYTVTLNANGGTPDVAKKISVTYEGTVSVNPAELPTRAKHTLVIWNTKADGSGTPFIFGTTKVTSDITIYAQWIGIPTLTANVKSASQIDLSWERITNITKYNLFDGSTQIGGDINDTKYSHTGLDESSIHSYTLKACNNGGCSDASNAVTATTNEAKVTVTEIPKIGTDKRFHYVAFSIHADANLTDYTLGLVLKTNPETIPTATAL